MNLEEQFDNEVRVRKLNVITSAKDIDLSKMAKIKMVVGLSKDDAMYVYKTKRWNAKTTLFYIGANYLTMEHFIQTLAQALVTQAGKKIFMVNRSIVKVS